MRSQDYSSWFVCLCVCVCVDAYSGTTGYEVANERYQRLQNYGNLSYMKQEICHENKRKSQYV